nr:unnamed protein product [Callosobruchus chinensis]
MGSCCLIPCLYLMQSSEGQFD